MCGTLSRHYDLLDSLRGRGEISIKELLNKPNYPSSARLHQNYPNPFSAGGGSAFGGNPTTNIEFRIAKFEFVTLKVFDLLGREVASLVDGRVEAGNHAVTLDASHLSSGIYFYRLTAGEFTDVKKLVLMK